MNSKEDLIKKVLLLNEQIDDLKEKNSNLSEELEQLRQIHVNTVDYSSVLENELEKKIELLTNKPQVMPHEDDHYKDLRIQLSMELARNEHLERINRSLMDQLEKFRLLFVNVSAHSTAVENDLDEKYEEVKRLSITDPLTGVYNRSGFYKHIELELERINRSHTELSIIMLDIDNFKSFNDNFGHEVGDNVLKSIVEIIGKSIRKSDTIARWGGEEFLIIVPDLSIEKTSDLAERIRKTIENELVIFNRPVTCSFGISDYREKSPIDHIINLADQALYKAKAAGKNRICRSQ